jgi:pimeloyl-ACP methyl ester carboxylesterase
MRRTLEVPPPPGVRDALREALGLLELPRLLLRAPRLAAVPRGTGAPVLVFPGYATTDASTAPLRGYLRWLGWDARGWGLGRNDGDAHALRARLLPLVEELATARGRLRLVGWSMGGYLAREVARDLPDAVENVVTLGSPVIGGPKYTAVAHAYRRRGHDLDAIEAAVAARGAVPLSVPVTAIYSRADGVVLWEACRDDTSPQVEHVEVSTTHVGLGFCPEVWEVIALRLARGRDGATCG